MSAIGSDGQVEVHTYLSPAERRTALVDDVRRGLQATPKSIPPTWFYDERGSELFEEITRLVEYYPTRVEHSILAAHADEIVEVAKADTLVELGSGSSEKTRLLLDAMSDAGRLERFVPFDVSEVILRSAATEISLLYGIPVTAVVGDFHRHLGQIPREGRRLVIFLGSTIGNLTPAQRHRFLSDLGSTMSGDDWLLLGTDLEKDVDRLIAAYDDASGVTAEFNLNVLRVLNDELGADFDLDRFEHLALWNADARRMEMHLRARSAQTVHVAELGMTVEFARGETLHTEISSKFTSGRIRAELEGAHYMVAGSWTDTDGDFLLTLAHPDSSS